MTDIMTLGKLLVACLTWKFTPFRCGTQ